MNAAVTDGILNVAEEWTGDRPMSCPWRALYEPFVQRVMEAYRFFESGQLAFRLPRPSYRLVAGISHYHEARGRVRSKLWDLKAEQRKANG